MASSSVLAVFTVVVAEATAPDAVTVETIAATDRECCGLLPLIFLVRGGSRGKFQRCTLLPVLQPSGDKSTVPCVLSSHLIYWDCRRIQCLPLTGRLLFGHFWRDRMTPTF